MNDRFFQGSQPYSLIVEVTPALAAKWLGECNTHNRKLVDQHVDRLARDMKAGRWRLTHQGIAFSAQRVLLDGQHRLWAVVLSDVTVRMRVFFNEPQESLASIDVIRARSNDEILSLAGGVGTVSKSELATLRAMLAGMGNYDRMPPGQEGEFLARHRQAVQFAHQALPTARFRGVATAVTRGVLARAYYAADQRRLRHFADVLQSGVAFCEGDQPVALLLKFLIESANGRRGRPEVRERYGKTERALSAYLAGEQILRLYAAPTELFPLPNEAVAA
jgi:hypothetical protein